MGYNGYTEKKKASNKRYLDKMARIPVIVTPEQKKIIEEKAANAGKSVNQFIKDSVLTLEEQTK